MLTEKLQENLFKLVLALEGLEKQGYFDFLIKCSRMYHNYEFLIVAEINTSEINIFDENSDIAKIAEKISNKIEVDTSGYDISQLNFEKITVTKINNKGFKLFPSNYHESNTIDLQNLREQYFKYLGLNLDWIKEALGEKGFIDFIKRLFEDRYNKDQENVECLTLDPSTFYFLNEISADSFSSGFWNDCLQIFEDSHEFRYNYYKNIEDIDIFNLDLEYSADELFMLFRLFENSKINFCIDARLFYDGEVFDEKIYQIPDNNLINKNLRGFHNGYYCPIGKSEVLSKLPYSIEVIETINRLVEYIETLPLTGQKEVVVKHVNKVFKEKGWNEEREITEKIYEELLFKGKEISDMKKQIEEGQKRNEAGIEQIIRKLTPKIPSICSVLFPEHRERYLNIFRDIFMIIIPIENEDTPKYKDIFSSLGLLVGNILTYFLCGSNTPKDITISNLRDSHEINLLLVKLDEGDREILHNYSIKYGKMYNDIRHDDVNTDINYDQMVDFIRESHKVIEIAVKYKQSEID